MKNTILYNREIYELYFLRSLKFIHKIIKFDGLRYCPLPYNKTFFFFKATLKLAHFRSPNMWHVPVAWFTSYAHKTSFDATQTNTFRWNYYRRWSLCFWFAVGSFQLYVYNSKYFLICGRMCYGRLAHPKQFVTVRPAQIASFCRNR